MTRQQSLLAQAIEQKIVDGDTTAIGIMDFDGLTATVGALQDAFPENFRHTFAVKANSLRAALIKLKSTGIGAEVASPGELELALSAGFGADDIIFDSPAKTRSDLRRCLQEGIAVNLDNEQELARIDSLMGEFPSTRSIIGFRVNSQIGAGRSVPPRPPPGPRNSVIPWQTATTGIACARSMPSVPGCARSIPIPDRKAARWN